MTHIESYNVAGSYGSSCKDLSSAKGEKFTCQNPDNTTTQIISKIAKGALALCSLFWTALAGLSIEHLLVTQVASRSAGDLQV